MSQKKLGWKYICNTDLVLKPNTVLQVLGAEQYVHMKISLYIYSYMYIYKYK